MFKDIVRIFSVYNKEITHNRWNLAGKLNSNLDSSIGYILYVLSMYFYKKYQNSSSVNKKITNKELYFYDVIF